MCNLNFINQSTDQNNSQVVIFQQNVSSPDEIATAWRIISVDAGASSAVPVSRETEFYVSIANPDIVVDGGIMTIKEFSTPAVSMKGGQTAYITGDSVSGYTITVKD